MKKKKIITAVIILAVTAAVIFIILFLTGKIFKRNKGDSYDEDIKILNESFPSDIIVYGEDVGFRETLKYRTVKNLSEEELTSDPQYKYTFLVINDRGGKLEFTDDDFKELKKIVDEKKISFFYIGDKYLEKIKEAGFYANEFSDDYFGIGYVISPYSRGHSVIHGLWTDTEEEMSRKNPELLGQILAMNFVDTVIKIFN